MSIRELGQIIKDQHEWRNVIQVKSNYKEERKPMRPEGKGWVYNKKERRWKQRRNYREGYEKEEKNIRNCKRKYKDFKDKEEEEVLYIGNIHYDTKEEEMIEYFGKYFIIWKIKLYNYFKSSFREKRYGFIWVNKREVQEIIQRIDNYEWKGRRISVQIAKGFNEKFQKKWWEIDEEEINVQGSRFKRFVRKDYVKYFDMVNGVLEYIHKENLIIIGKEGEKIVRCNELLEKIFKKRYFWERKLGDLIKEVIEKEKKELARLNEGNRETVWERILRENRKKSDLQKMKIQLEKFKEREDEELVYKPNCSIKEFNRQIGLKEYKCNICNSNLRWHKCILKNINGIK